jgi:hypothetical protein
MKVNSMQYCFLDKKYYVNKMLCQNFLQSISFSFSKKVCTHNLVIYLLLGF